MNGGAQKAGIDVDALSVLIQLEAAARRAESEKALQFLMVNETRQLVPFHQAFLLGANGKVLSASNVALVDGNAPYIVWLEKVAKALHLSTSGNKLQLIDAQSLKGDLSESWSEYALPFVLWCPLSLASGEQLGGVWLVRDAPWQEREMAILNHLSSTYAHAWAATTGGVAARKTNRRKKWLISLSIVFLVLMLPVRLSTLAPAEVVAAQPEVVTAPIDGVIGDIPLAPNTVIEAGDLLIEFDDTTLRNRLEVAEKTLAVAAAELQRASQGAFQDRRDSARTSVLRAEHELRRAERDYAADLLSKTAVRAARKGLLLYTDKSDWLGKPVVVGERLMEIADPKQVEIRIFLPVDSTIVIAREVPIDLFLNRDPLDSLKASVEYVAYHAEETPDSVLAYRIRASFIDTHDDLRIGLQGTAKIYGDRVILAYYLFHRPLAALRQAIGL